MRLQPPKNEKEFIGKEATNDVIVSYIGSHRLLYKDGETTLDEYLNSKEPFKISDIHALLSMFPYEYMHYADIYIDEVFSIHKKKSLNPHSPIEIGPFDPGPFIKKEE